MSKRDPVIKVNKSELKYLNDDKTPANHREKAQLK